jgi:heme A synthase
LLIKQVFTNEDGREGVLYLLMTNGNPRGTNDLVLACADITTLYRRRWSVESYHGSIKGHASLAKAPTKTKRTQKNHIFAAVYAFVKLEMLRLTTISRSVQGFISRRFRHPSRS